MVSSDDVSEDTIRRQVTAATEETDLVSFMTNVKNGLIGWDADTMQILRRTKPPVTLAGNEVDDSAEYHMAAEFYRLGLDNPQCISAAVGGDAGDLLDLVLEKLLADDEEALEEDIPRFVVVGRPNVSKSSLTDAFIGEDRHTVTEIADTTRDSIYTRSGKFGFDFHLVDTVSIRRKSKVSEDLELCSVMCSIRSVKNNDVRTLMIGAIRGTESQDMNIFQLIRKNRKSLVVVANKWDSVGDKGHKVIKTLENAIRERIAPLANFPITFVPALTKRRIFKVLETARQVCPNRESRIGTSRLNEVMFSIIEKTSSPLIKGKYTKIKYRMQSPNTQTLSSVLYANPSQYARENYRRFLENRIRENWTLTGRLANVFTRQK